MKIYNTFYYIVFCNLYIIFMIFFIIMFKSNIILAFDHNFIEIFSGNTMGTTYHIKVVIPNNNNKKLLSVSVLSTLIEEKLKLINQSMSVYLPNSEISLFNRANKKDVIKISPEFNEVMLVAQKLYIMTEGAWDGTVKPLVDLWGFGTKKEINISPSSEIIKAHLKTIGFNNIIIKNKTLQKKHTAITLDLGSIAKGFGVDAIAELLKSQGYFNFLIEIGGEVIASGEKIPVIGKNVPVIGKNVSVAGKKVSNEEKTPVTPWMVGISKPEKGKNPDVIYCALSLKDKALATSGDYRNFIIINGKSYTHIINPITGYPVDNGVVSASVIADTCTFADGLATALMVMGPEKGIELVNRLENTECLIVIKDKSGHFIDYKSKKWQGCLQYGF